MFPACLQASKAKDFVPARDFSKHEGSTHINLIEQLQELSLAGNNILAGAEDKVYGNGISGGHHADEDMPDGKEASLEFSIIHFIVQAALTTSAACA